MYKLNGLSFREYLVLKHKIIYPKINFEDILFSSKNYLQKFPINFRPLSNFKEYQEFGYYPFTIKYQDSFHQKINQLVSTIIEYDMSEIHGFEIRNAQKMLNRVYPLEIAKQ